jgi:hypothetical protein
MRVFAILTVLLAACASAPPPLPAPCMSPGACSSMGTAQHPCELKSDYAGNGVCICRDASLPPTARDLAAVWPEIDREQKALNAERKENRCVDCTIAMARYTDDADRACQWACR